MVKRKESILQARNFQNMILKLFLKGFINNYCRQKKVLTISIYKIEYFILIFNFLKFSKMNYCKGHNSQATSGIGNNKIIKIGF